MDFIERFFDVAPDGGDGSFEFMLFVIPIAGIVVLLWRQRLKRQRGVARRPLP